MHTAAGRGHIDLVLFLIEKDADVNLKDNNGLTALHHSINDNQIHVVKLLMTKSDITEKDKYGHTLLTLAISNHCFEIAHELATVIITDRLKKGINNADIIDYLVANENFNVNFKKKDNGETLLHYASSIGDLDFVKYLVNKKGANVNMHNNNLQTALHKAATVGNVRIVSFLVEKGAKVTNDNYGRTPLFYAQSQTHSEVIVFFNQGTKRRTRLKNV